MDFLSFRGQNLEATVVRVGSQEFVFAAIPADNFDAATSRILAQQNIEIKPGVRVRENSTGTLYEVCCKPHGHSRIVDLWDIRRSPTSLRPVPEDELRKKFRFVS